MACMLCKAMGLVPTVGLYSVPGLYICPEFCKAIAEAVTGNLGVVSELMNVRIVDHDLVQLLPHRMAMAISVQQNYVTL